jgi:hypothetical protein
MKSAKSKQLGEKNQESRHCIWLESKTDFLELFGDLSTPIDIETEETLVLKNGIGY